MAEFKQTGIEWLPEIPGDWELRRLATIGTFSKGGNISRSELLDEEGGKPAILYGDIYTKYNIEVEKAVNRISVETSEKAVEIKSGAILLTGSGETKEDIGKCVVYLGHEPAFVGGDVIIFSQNGCDSKFLSYALNCRSAIYQKTIFGKGDIIVHIYGSQLRDLKIGLPPLSIQYHIVRYLDHQTAAIRHFLEKKQQLVALLKEQRQAIINEAVTRGIDPGAKMKDSGVAWLGEVPVEWEVRRLKNCLKERLRYGANETGGAYDPVLYRYIRITDFSMDGKLDDANKLSLPIEIGKNYELQNGDILFARSGATVGKTFQFKSDDSQEKYCHAGYLIKAVANEGVILSDFLFEYTNSIAFENWKNMIFSKATIENISAEKYNGLYVPLPPIATQQSIIAHLRSETQTIDTAIEKAQREMDLMREYREAMIGEAVTGRLKISA